MGINSDGCWSGLRELKEWNIGKSPSMARLLSNYALASCDHDYLNELSFALATHGKTDRLDQYLDVHKDELLNGLTEDMRAVIKEYDSDIESSKKGRRNPNFDWTKFFTGKKTS